MDLIMLLFHIFFGSDSADWYQRSKITKSKRKPGVLTKPLEGITPFSVEA